jgi:prolyl 4-hydroxylase
MQEAMDRSEKEDPPTATEANILEYLAFALFKQGNVKRALLATDRLYELNPKHPRAKGNLLKFLSLSFNMFRKY